MLVLRASRVPRKWNNLSFWWLFFDFHLRHAMCHMVLSLRFSDENLRNHKTLAEEDMLGKITKLASSCHGATAVIRFSSDSNCFFQCILKNYKISQKRKSLKPRDGGPDRLIKPASRNHARSNMGGRRTQPWTKHLPSYYFGGFLLLRI